MSQSSQNEGCPPTHQWWKHPDAGMPPVLTSRTPLFKPHIWKPEIETAGGPRWRVHLDVAHFAVREISVCIQDGFLQVVGRHEERPDRDGFVSRCFTRKYKLPAAADERKMVSSLSADGILTAEVPIPADSVPAASIVIPIKVEVRGAVEEEEEESLDGSPPAEASQEEECAGPPCQDREDRDREDEESQREPAAESRPSRVDAAENLGNDWQAPAREEEEIQMPAPADSAEQEQERSLSLN
ncbi:alpha-crystallin B chain-like [Hippocampus zosterae]|uniref:alpha-crystallin B chain-like n=1 Tax=Hippocampus zosterae TaxID=109293 RepID=UPI00223E265B|nr:alpha-crystallin B chain-like [Hippocampus zosterae]